MIACVLVGFAAGAAIPRVTAQAVATRPHSRRWQHVCASSTRGSAVALRQDVEEIAIAKGVEGWELAGMTGDTGAVVFCFKRLVP